MYSDDDSSYESDHCYETESDDNSTSALLSDFYYSYELRLA